MASLETFFFDKFPNDEPVPASISGENARTETIDLDDIFDSNSSGSFRFTKMEAGFLGNLLHALPIPALLVDNEGMISFINKACEMSEIYKGDMKSRPFGELFPYTEHSHACNLAVQNVLTTRKTYRMTALLELNGHKMWGRLHLRSIRAWQQRFVLVLIEDLTLEKKQLILTKRHQEELRKAYDQLEIRVREQNRRIDPIK